MRGDPPVGTVDRVTSRRLAVFDIVAAGALLLLSVLLVIQLDLPWPAYGLVVAHTVPLAWRRRAPVPAAAIAFLAAIVFGVAGYPIVGLGVAAVVWCYSIGAEVARPASLVMFAVAELGRAAFAAVGYGDLSTWFGDAVVLLVAFLLGESARRRRALLAAQHERADQLERTQEEVAKRAVAEERLRIARELHDVVAHSMSLIAVQAGNGRLALDADPATTRQALAVIEDASRSALDEMRRLLGALRDDDAGGRVPAPTLDAIDHLIETTRAAGVPTSLQVEGDRRVLPSGMELAAYRILQEALTNVVRHAPGAAADVVLTFRSRSLQVTVTNGPPPSRPAPATNTGPGHGLVGMRERAVLYNGTVQALPRRDGGYRVSVELFE